MTTSNLERYVDGQKMGRSMVVHGHIWLEHVLIRSLVAKLPNPDALLLHRTMGFALLVALCEALGVIEPALARALRLQNSIRNKCAHAGRYEPSPAELEAIGTALRELGAAVPDDPSPWFGALIHLGDLLEQRARAAGATGIETLLPEKDPLCP